MGAESLGLDITQVVEGTGEGAQGEGSQSGDSQGGGSQGGDSQGGGSQGGDSQGVVPWWQVLKVVILRRCQRFKEIQLPMNLTPLLLRKNIELTLKNNPKDTNQKVFKFLKIFFLMQK